MDTSAIVSLATEISQVRTADAVQIAVLKKAIDIGASGALQLLQALPAPTPVNNPPHLGNSVNTFA